MTFLILAIVSSTCNHLLFKAFARLRIDLLSAIVVNYAVCVVIGYNASGASFARSSIFIQDWYPFSVIQGAVFVVCLLLIGRTTEKQGVSVASLATRLSVAIPAFTAFLLYDDLVSASKITGILAALLALYLSCIDFRGSADPFRLGSMLPLALFTAFGTHATLVKFVQEKFLGSTSYHVYVMACFFIGVFNQWIDFGLAVIQKATGLQVEGPDIGPCIRLLKLRLCLFPHKGTQCYRVAEFTAFFQQSVLLFSA